MNTHETYDFCEDRMFLSLFSCTPNFFEMALKN